MYQLCEALESTRMATFEITITITDVTEVNASSEAEAYEIARSIFNESGYDMERSYALNITNYSEEDY